MTEKRNVAQISMQTDTNTIRESILQDEISSETGNSTKDAIVIFRTHVNECFEGISGELKQVDKLVEEAVNGLVANLNTIDHLNTLQHNMLPAIKIKLAGTGNPEMATLLDGQIEMVGEIRQELDMAYTFLQVGDMICQLLTHTKFRVEVINNALQCVNQQGDNCDDTRLQQIYEEISRAVVAANTLSCQKKVPQHDLQSGGIELF